MHTITPPPLYKARIVPALQRIQDEFGFLKRESLVEAAHDLHVPLHRLQAVASFFPHFRLSPPKKIVLSICRDMSCHLSGAPALMEELQALAGDNVEIKGVSCVGRCDRAPAACMACAGAEHEKYYLGRTASELKEIVQSQLSGKALPPDLDADQGYGTLNFVINPYGKDKPKYAAAAKVISIRDSSIDAAGQVLASRFGWSSMRIEQFRRAALYRQSVDAFDKEISEAAACWASDKDWAQGPTLGGWSETILQELKDADLRGMGGAGIPSIQKLRDVRDAIRRARLRQADGRGFIVVNGDESEPGTFKDRELLLHMPHLIVEGVIIAGLITEATQGFIYIRHEYAEQIAACEAEIGRAEQLGLCGRDAYALGRPFPISVFVSPGGYICGEQSALIEAMSDRRGEPRNLPPKLETNGLENLPTIVSNVETYAWYPYICLNSGKTYAGLGVNGWQGRRFFSISGDVSRPGVYEVPMGLTVRELIYGENFCRGMIGNRKLKAFAPSGPSGGFLPAKLTAGMGLPRDHINNKAWIELAKRRGFDPAATELDILDLELELNLFRALSPTQALGAGLVVYAEGRDMLDQAVNSMEFYRNESCGKCVPCRIGSQKMASLGAHLLNHEIDAARWKNNLLPLFREMSRAIELASICGLGRSVPVPLRCVASYFENDLHHHLSSPSKPALSSAP
ncbi:MAG TPA: NAD(P)H-dependent oxidoreductase subunit E [Candidatus Methylacidiphilales bacterium]|nr:NAD(P)H-dependent oxidoreductase subunit E [Candidatus Methylacidiphilales bacterium]